MQMSKPISCVNSLAIAKDKDESNDNEESAKHNIIWRAISKYPLCAHDEEMKAICAH